VESSELRYRSLLATAYWELTKDLDVLYIFYQQNESCVAMASAVAALRLASGLKTEPLLQVRLERWIMGSCWRGRIETTWVASS
jgi:hypothetical protein